ncbi:preprotein translocase subunit SecY [Candidatus Cardinium hertigii]|uniref:Protein translocase subunit SecY n=1 Tax=Candidatus Cardinium hertigii TaxID=247481 RepID=A0A2Z3LH43_9BACT|nr:preprotein translocase subunit SecY [Candidatus Cardinium hertigii]AWN81744.1 Protein translocase subunit SecY [Candidatus Cardinium hertigii]
MNKLFQTIKDIYQIKELRVRVRNTFFFLLFFRAGTVVVLPGINMERLSSNVKGMLGLLDSFLGSSFSKASVFALGVAPYISASIVMHLLAIAWPKVQKIQREGEVGRRRIAQITRKLTIFIAIFQSFQYILFTSREGVVAINQTLFMVMAIIILTAGTLFCMWIGEQLTDRGIGNGVTMLIMVGIVSSFPAALYEEARFRGSKGMFVFMLELLLLFFILVVVVAFTQATRKVPIQYAKQLSSSTVYGGQRQYLPFKLNSVGVMPIIFANMLVFLVTLLLRIKWLGGKFAWLMDISNKLQDATSWLYNVLFGLLIILFTFFYTAFTVNPVQIAEDMKRNGSFIPGIASGNATACFLDNVLERITFYSAIFLAVIAVLPLFARMAGLSPNFSQFYGGSALLIMVGSMLEIIQQMESYLLMRRYELIINKGARIR